MKKTLCVVVIFILVAVGAVMLSGGRDQNNPQKNLPQQSTAVSKVQKEIVWHEATASPEPTPIPQPREYKPREVKLSFEPLEVDITKRYIDGEHKKRMEEEESKYQKGKEGTIAQNNTNSEKEYKTSVGTFRVVTSYGHHSMDPKGYHYGGWRSECLQLPSGQWMLAYPGPFSIEKVLELDGKVYLITSSQIYQWRDEKTTVAVVMVDDHQSYIQTNRKANDGRWAGKYFAVNRSSESNFGGLLEYVSGTWKFHSYVGRHHTWVESADEQDGILTLTLCDSWWGREKDRPANVKAPRIQFDPVEGTFSDLK